MLEALKEKLSILACKYYFDGFRGKEKIDINGEKVEAYIFDGFYGGMNTLWGDILLNEIYLEDDMEKARERILLHEMQHEKESTIRQAIGGSLQMLLYPPILALSFFISALLTIDIVFQPELLNFYSFLIDSRTLLFYIIIIYLISSIISILSELKTNLVVMEKMGVEDYIEATEDSRERYPEPGILGKISVRLSHPSAKMVRKTYRTIHDNHGTE